MKRQYFKSFDGENIAFEVIGNLKSKKSIIFVNGLFSTESYFKYIIKKFKNDYKIITFDLRGHQHSSEIKDYTTATIENCSKDISFLMKHLKLQKSHFIAFSLGVQILLDFYEHNPRKCKSLSLISGPYENPFGSLYGIKTPKIIWKSFFKFSINQKAQIISKLYQGFFYTPLAHPLAKISQSTRANKSDMIAFYNHQKSVNMKCAMNLAKSSIDHSAKNTLDKINVPTLIIGGNKDGLTPSSLSKKMHEMIHNSKLKIFDKGTHTTIVEYPREINKEISQFLDNL